ncbi:MAG: carbonic anhydrase [Chromatiaceae bacterium]|jgi:carbonic anhydrase
MRQVMLLAGMLLASCSAYSAAGPHWEYSGAEGPGNWASLSPDYGACSGRNQSPIDLTGFVEADLSPIQFSYQPGGTEILNNGHTVQVNYAPGSRIELDGHVFELKQFHFHAPSENHINGKSYPMEAHLVHSDKDGHLAVVAVMLEEGEANKGIEAAWAGMPEKEGEKHALPAAVAAESLLPANRDYYRFNGSLTTPPCSEGVWWLVMKAPVSASKEEIEHFAHVMHHPNNRPVQPANARPVLQ